MLGGKLAACRLVDRQACCRPLARGRHGLDGQTEQEWIAEQPRQPQTFGLLPEAARVRHVARPIAQQRQHIVFLQGLKVQDRHLLTRRYTRQCAAVAVA